MDGSVQRVTIWSAASVLIVACALIATGISLWRGIHESDRYQIVSARQLEAEGTHVRVTGFGDPVGFEVGVLGGMGTAVTVNEVGIAPEVGTPEGTHVLALTRPSGALLGLHRTGASPLAGSLNKNADNGPDELSTISPRTTAQALVALAPGVLSARPATTDRRVDEVVGTVEFETLVAEIARNSDLAVQNARLDAALANVLSRIPGTPQADQSQCEPAEALAAGVCFASTLDGAVIPGNGQNRWAVAFEAGTMAACALIPPVSPKASANLTDACPRMIDIASPGSERDSINPMATEQQLVASFLTALTEYGLPFADLTLGADAINGGSAETLQGVPSMASRLFTGIASAQPDARPASATLSNMDASNVERSTALLTLSRLALTNAEFPTMLLDQPDFNPSPASVALLNLYERATANRTGGIGPPRWDATGWARVDLAVLSPGETP